MKGTEKWTYGNMTQAMGDYFEAQLTEDDYSHKDLDEMEALFELYVMQEFAKGAFDGEDLGMCIDRALSYMPEAMEDARNVCDDNRD